MKKILLSMLFFLAVGGIFAQTSTGGLNGTEDKTKNVRIEKTEETPNRPSKFRNWTEEEASNYMRITEKEKPKNTANLRTVAVGTYANGNLSGEWKSKGPYNMPGAFAFCELDEGTDTLYTVTCGHYGEVQFIWKGPISGDKWTMINPKNPFRFEDLIVIPNGTKRRVIAAIQKGKIMYSDDGGKNWVYSTGISGGIHSTIINRQDNNVIYATDGKNVYKSIDKGTSFTVFQVIGMSATNARLYTPRYSNQTNAIDVYLAVDTKFYKLNIGKTAFAQAGTLTANGRIGIGGDSRRLWVCLNDRIWYYSTNGGATWTYRKTLQVGYGTTEPDMPDYYRPCISPEDPNIILGGYPIPISSRDGGVTFNTDAMNFWPSYQNQVGNDNGNRVNYHPDFQASQFFYDKAGKLFSIRSSDGGLYRSYNEWTKTSFPDLASIQATYYNITLYGIPTLETYQSSFMYGANNINDMSVGTQDRGWQNTRLNTYSNTNLSWDEVIGGDGPGFVTADGKTAWTGNYYGTGEFKKMNLYTGSTYVGFYGTQTPDPGLTFPYIPGTYYVADWNDPNRMWVLSANVLRKVQYSTVTLKTTVTSINLTNTNEAEYWNNEWMQGLAQSRKTPDNIYVMQNGFIFKSTNRGVNYTQIANQSATGVIGGRNPGVGLGFTGMGWGSPLDEKIVLFAVESGTAVKSILSKDGGITWTNVTGTGANLFPPAKVNGMAGTADGTKVFASTSMGPYVFIVSEQKWYPLAVDASTPIFNGQSMYCVKYGTQEVARFSTWGQGMWDFVISSPVTNIDPLTQSYYHLVDVLTSDYMRPTAGGATATITQYEEAVEPTLDSYQWEFQAVTGTSYYYIVNKLTKNAIQPSGGVVTDNVGLSQTALTGTNAGLTELHWSIIPSDQAPYYWIKNRKSGLYIRPNAGTNGTGVTIVQNTLNAAYSSFKWNLVNKGPKPVVLNGTNVTASRESTELSEVSEETNGAVIYPNPANGIIYVSTDIDEMSDVKINIYTLAGGVILSTDYGNRVGKFNESLDVSGFISGTYILKISKGEKIETKKLIKF